MSKSESRSDAILKFWFGDVVKDIDALPKQQQLWWGKNAETDAAISAQFSNDLIKASQGDYDEWANYPRSLLALIILLDQFSRNIYRDTPNAFIHDKQALHLSLQGIECGDDQLLSPLERVFFYMPLEHSEDKAIQEKSVACFAALRQQAPAQLQSAMSGFYDYAQAHFEVIKRFNRFPHRNLILGRESTPEEQAYLKQPDAGF